MGWLNGAGADLLQIVGALLVLAGYALVQFRVLTSDGYPYLVANAVGAAILAVLALLDGRWGFLLLEGTWTLVSCWGILGRLRAAPATPSA